MAHDKQNEGEMTKIPLISPSSIALLTVLLVTTMTLIANAEQAPETEPAETPGAEEAQPAADSDALQQAREQIQSLTERLERLEGEADARRRVEEEAELEALRQAAEEMASAPETAEERSAEISSDETFTSGQRSLQALNPELSVVIDSGLQLQMNDGDPGTFFGAGEESHSGHSHGAANGTGFYFRHLGLHFETNLDPFSFMKTTIGVNPNGVFLGEAYITWVRVLPGVRLTLGKFLQPFGVVSRWHIPSLDQYDQPLAITELLGGGINQIGMSFEWLIPTDSDRRSHELIAQVTTPNNGHLFTGEYFDVPTVLLRLRNYFDLTDNTYLELGLTGMWGANHQDEGHASYDPIPAFDEYGEPIMGYDENGEEIGQLTMTPAPEHLDEFWGNTWLAGADLTISWSPLDRERYRHITWRSEFYFVRREDRCNPTHDHVAHCEEEDGVIQAMGGYTYLDLGVSEDWALGVRGDVTQPFAFEQDGVRWALSAYATWWQSPWVRLRLQYTHADGGGQAMLDRLVLQFVFAAGPHKHERY